MRLRESLSLIHHLPSACVGWHGHRCDVWITWATADGITTADVRQTFQQQVSKALCDAGSLNALVSPATGENLVKWIVARLQPALGSALLAIELQETAKNHFRWQRD